MAREADVEINAAKEVAPAGASSQMDTVKDSQCVSKKPYNTGSRKKVSEVKLFGSISIYIYIVLYLMHTNVTVQPIL